MSKIDQVIADLAKRFAADLLTALRQASLDDVAEHVDGRTRTRRGRSVAAVRRTSVKTRNRRSLDEINQFAERIIAVVKVHRDGISAEEMKTILKLPSGPASQKVIAKPLAIALTSKRVRKTG